MKIRKYQPYINIENINPTLTCFCPLVLIQVCALVLALLRVCVLVQKVKFLVLEVWVRAIRRWNWFNGFQIKSSRVLNFWIVNCFPKQLNFFLRIISCNKNLCLIITIARRLECQAVDYSIYILPISSDKSFENKASSLQIN